MAVCLKCKKNEVAPDQKICEPCYLQRDRLQTLRTVFAILGVFFSLPFSFLACYFWARYKNRSAWFTLLGFLGWIGYLFMATLKDKNIINQVQSQNDAKEWSSE